MGKFKFPSAYTILFFLIAVVAVLTWIVPAGQYHMAMNEALGKEVPVAGTYAHVAAHPQGLVSVLMAPIAGLYDPESGQAGAIDVALFILIIGGFLGIVTKTGAIDAGIERVTTRLRGREEWMIPILMALFAAGGTIYGMAEEIGLQVANKPDSQDICFVPDGDYATFIEENADTPIRQGNFVTPDGKILGKHKGIIHYTVGQRKGLGLALGYPAFVLEIRPETDEVVIGTYEESLTHTLRANELNFMSVEDITEPIRVFAKIRYNHKGAWCTVEKTGEDEITCTFDEPIRAVTPGQAVVLYDGEYVLGGGTIL